MAFVNVRVENPDYGWEEVTVEVPTDGRVSLVAALQAALPAMIEKCGLTPEQILAVADTTLRQLLADLGEMRRGDDADE